MVNRNFYQAAASLIQKGQFDQAISQLAAHLDAAPTDTTAISMMGSAHLRAGKTEEAFSWLEKGIELDPKSYAAHADIAFAAMKSEDAPRAVLHFEKAVELNPGFYQAWGFLGKLYYDTGNFAAAMKAVDEAEKCDPFDNEYKNIQAAMRANQKGKAEQIARSILSRQPGHPRAAFVLSHLAGTIGAHEESANILQHGLDYNPANIMLRRSLVQAFEATGDYPDALLEAKRLTEISPDYRNWLIVSRVQGQLGDFVEALSAAEQADAVLEDNSSELGKIDLMRAHSLKILGRREESETAYRACLANTPDNGAGWWGLADLKNYAFSDTDKAAMEALTANEQADQVQRCQAAFALAKAYENDGDTASAFDWYKVANGLRADVNFTKAENDAFCEGRVKVFNKAMLEKQAAPLPKGPTPIFIVGLPRAGSTLIEQILASHSLVEGTMELTALPNLERKIRIEGGRKFKKQYPSSLADFSAEELTAFGQEYLDKTAVYRSGKDYFIDKLPPNFERVGLIHKILPQAIIIDARRHPLDCGYSAYKQHFAAGHEFSYDLEHTGIYYNGYLLLMDHWDAVLPGKVACVQYEDMVRDTEATVRSLLEQIGLEFEENCLRFFENKRAVRTASSEQVRQPINTKGLKPWAEIEDRIEPLKRALGEATLTRFAEYL